MKFCSESDKIVANHLRWLLTGLNLEQSEIALFRFSDELKCGSWNMTQLTNAILTAELLHKIALKQAPSPYRALSLLILRSCIILVIKLVPPLTGRAPPPLIESFIPIPKIETGGCARSDSLVRSLIF